MKNKAILSLLLCGLMLYYAVPRLVADVNSTQGIFSMAWLLLALFVVGGNISSFLYAPKKLQQQRRMVKYTNRKTVRKHMRERG